MSCHAAYRPQAATVCHETAHPSCAGRTERARECTIARPRAGAAASAASPVLTIDVAPAAVMDARREVVEFTEPAEFH